MTPQRSTPQTWPSNAGCQASIHNARSCGYQPATYTLVFHSHWHYIRLSPSPARPVYATVSVLRPGYSVGEDYGFIFAKHSVIWRDMTRIYVVKKPLEVEAAWGAMETGQDV
jgi:hypothetical protein